MLFLKIFIKIFDLRLVDKNKRRKWKLFYLLSQFNCYFFGDNSFLMKPLSDNVRFMVKPQTSDIRVYTSGIRMTYEWHTDDIRVHTCDMRMTYEYIRVTQGWHTSDIRMTHDWHTNSMRVHTSDIRVHTIDIRTAYEYI